MRRKKSHLECLCSMNGSFIEREEQKVECRKS